MATIDSAISRLAVGRFIRMVCATVSRGVAASKGKRYGPSKAREGSEANHNRASKACIALSKLGIYAAPHYVSGMKVGDSGYTGKVIIDPALLADLIPGVELAPIQPFNKAQYLKQKEGE